MRSNILSLFKILEPLIIFIASKFTYSLHFILLILLSIGINVNKKDEAISECKMKIIKLETDINSIENQIESRYAEMQKQINAIYEDFNTKIVGGRIFTDVILSSVITSYKSGFIEYLPKFYSTEEVSIRVKDIEQILNH